MKHIRVLRHEDSEGIFTYDIEVNRKIWARELSKMDAWDWIDEFAEDCECKCDDYEIKFVWA